MVVSRKNPGPAVASRTNSAQGAARRPKNAAVEPSSPQPQRVASTSGSPASSKVHRSPSSHTPKATSRKTTRWTDRVFLYGLLSFVLYAASICTPHSHKGTPYDAQPLTCRALVTYRSAILEPYVVPAVSFTYSHTLGHPAVQTHVQPYTAQIKEHARPVLGALETAYEKGVKPTIHVVHGTLYKGYIQPWYQTAFLPRWNKHVAPRLLSGWQNGVQAPLQPYIDIAKQYARHAQVYLHTHGIHRVKDALQPLYLHLQSAYISAKPTILNLYAQAKPMLLTIWSAIRQAAESLWVHGRPYACQAWKTARVYLGFALKEGVQARRTYVDPHVHKILERVSVSGGNGAVATSTRGVPDEAVNRVEEEEEEVVFVVKKDDETLPSAEEPTPTGAAAEETIEIPVTPSPTAIVEEDAATPPAASPLEHAEEETLLVPPPSTPSATPSPATPVDSSSEIEETLRSAVTFANPDPSAPVKDDARNVIEELQAANEQDVERLIKEAADFAVEELLQSPVAPTAAASTASPNPTSTTETVKETDSTPTSTPAAVADDDEFDDFLNELGIEPSEPEENGHIHTSSEHLTESAQALQDAFSSSNAEPEKVEEPRELTEEEKLEKAKEETARKRADILRRHHAWQQQLDDLVKSQKQSVVDNVDAVRLWAASELGDEYLVGGERDFTGVEGVKYRKVERTDGEQEQGLGKRMLGGVEREGGRLLRGLETYLSKAQTRSASWKRDESGETEQEKARKTAVLDGEKKKWEEVVGKVEEKFATIVRGVQGEVHEWYKGMRGREHDLAIEAAAAVKHLAETAQSDIAMDYAWLDDVTYRDWQAYHDLVRTYERFEVEAAHFVYNSSNPNSGSTAPTTPSQEAAHAAGGEAAKDKVNTETPKTTPPQPTDWPAFHTPDPLVVGLNKLQANLDDVVAGFSVGVVGMKNRARFEIFIASSGDDEPSDGFFAVKHEKGELVDDMRHVPGYAGEVKGGEGVGRILVGKDPKVVEANLAKAIEHEEL